MEFINIIKKFLVIFFIISIILIFLYLIPWAKIFSSLSKKSSNLKELIFEKYYINSKLCDDEIKKISILIYEICFIIWKDFFCAIIKMCENLIYIIFAIIKIIIFFLLTFGIILHSLVICFILIMDYVFDAFLCILKIIYKFFKFLI